MKYHETIVAHSVPAWLPLTENWIYNHINNIDFVNSVVITRRLINIDQYPWHPVYSTSANSRRVIKVVKKLGIRWHPSTYDKAILRHKPEILHSHFGYLGWYDLPLVSKHGLKHIVTFYGADVNMFPTQRPRWRKRYRDMFSKSDLFLCEGPYMARSLVNLGCPEEKVRVQRLGVDIEQIAYVPRNLKQGEPLKILMAGSFREKKGLPYALEAVGRLRKNGVDIRATVIGDSTGSKREETEKRKILAVIERYDLKSVTRLLGYLPQAELKAEAYEHHIFLSPSVTAFNGDTEGGAPVSIIEMAASGMPVVSTRHCDIPQIILDNQTGWLAEERDIEGLVTHLRWLQKHPHLWRIKTDRGRKHIEANFDVRTQAESLGNKYQRLANAE